MTIGELPAVNVPPLLMKFPPNVVEKFPVFKVEPLFMVRGTPELRTFAPFMVITPALAMVTPPVPPNGVVHSAPVVLEVAVLYCKVAAAP